MSAVTARLEPLQIPTYPVGSPERNPVFFEKRVYQGSSGKVYPVPFIDKIHDEKQEVIYQSARLENDFVKLVLLPEIGGRIFLGQDKTNNDYDFFYRQDVIKPALVGLAGPWISGGVEFNWPQHHRPGTFMPSDVFIEEEEDGSRTVWMSEHDPIHRLKGMHGIHLFPNSSRVELRARLYNRTSRIRTFLWWANVAARVHDQYQSFFPADVHYVADHAVRALSSFPKAENPYYGIDYQNPPGANDLSWYRNIPVPTSYMVCQTRFDFFGGYDHQTQGRFVHVANRHIAPGKKQWTWGNGEFGWAWDRELTDENGPYVELMAGVYTDNQPDFSYLHPYETKTFTQSWWPIKKIGPVQQANEQAALALRIRVDRTIDVGLCVSEPISGRLILSENEQPIGDFSISLRPGDSFLDSSMKFSGENSAGLTAEFRDLDGRVILRYSPVPTDSLTRDRQQATAPASPDEIPSNEELFLIGEHLEQYRHPTLAPEPYWEEAIRREPGDLRCHTALGKSALERGQYQIASEHFQKAIHRLTARHPNPLTGEAHYLLGLTLRYMGALDEAYGCFYKSIWNYEWRSAAYYQLATIDCIKGNPDHALERLNDSLSTNQDHSKALSLKALILNKTGKREDALRSLESILMKDPLDHWARICQSLISSGSIEIHKSCRNDAQTILDVAFDFIEAGFLSEALELIEKHEGTPTACSAVPNPLQRSPMTDYLKAWLLSQQDSEEAPGTLKKARSFAADHFFPSRLEEMHLLDWALEQPGDDGLAAYGLGNLLYDKKRHQDAIKAWKIAADAGCRIPQVYRNLGIAVWNSTYDGQKAAHYYEQAIALDKSDARLISEYDHLSAKRRLPVSHRLDFLRKHRELVDLRDDATVSLTTLLNDTSQPEQALEILLSRRFHPWEGAKVLSFVSIQEPACNSDKRPLSKVIPNWHKATLQMRWKRLIHWVKNTTLFKRRQMYHTGSGKYALPREKSRKPRRP